MTNYMLRAIDYECPKCGARPGEYCTFVTPGVSGHGDRRAIPHEERMSIPAGVIPIATDYQK